MWALNHSTALLGVEQSFTMPQYPIPAPGAVHVGKCTPLSSTQSRILLAGRGTLVLLVFVFGVCVCTLCVPGRKMNSMTENRGWWRILASRADRAESGQVLGGSTAAGVTGTAAWDTYKYG